MFTLAEMTSAVPHSRRLRVAVLASGAGTTFAALADGLRDEGIAAEVVLLIVSRPDVGAARLAVGGSIESVVLDQKAIGAQRCDEEMVAVRPRR